MLSFELMTQAASVQSATRESRFLKDARCVKMSFPTLLVRPNEKNPKVLRCHEFLRQSNQLVEKNLINTEGRKMLAKMLTKMVVEVKGIYALDEKCAELAKSGKLLEKLKMSHQTSISVMEDRCALADLSRQVQEKKLVVQRKYYECDHFRKSVQAINAEIRREKEMNEKRLSNTSKATEELVSKSASILKLLENSADVTKLRTMEEEKRILEEKVNNLRLNKKAMADDILTKKATLKAESKRSFKRTLIECAKHYKLCESLTPKLEKSMKNLELLRDEEESRRASGCLDETMQFDRSFVLASMSKDESPKKISQVQSSGNGTNTQQKNVAVSGFIGSVLEQRENRMEVDENHVSDIPIDTRSTIAAAKEHELVSQDIIPETPIPPVCCDTMVMDTQEVETRETSPEPEEEDAEGEKQLNRSLDVMDVDEDGGEKVKMIIEPEENDETNFFKSSVNTENPVSSKPANPAMSMKKQEALNKPYETEPIESNANNKAIETQNESNLRLDEEESLSENVSNRSNNFSFNFFENNKGEDNGGVNGSENDSDGHFDFNFGGISAGDDGSNNGSGGGFDFLAVEDEGQGSGNMASDPFGFGSNAGETGGGDVSFNFNFDGDNDGGATSGADGNGTSFFNF